MKTMIDLDRELRAAIKESLHLDFNGRITDIDTSVMKRIFKTWALEILGEDSKTSEQPRSRMEHGWDMGYKEAKNEVKQRIMVSTEESTMVGVRT